MIYKNSEYSYYLTSDEKLDIGHFAGLALTLNEVISVSQDVSEDELTEGGEKIWGKLHFFDPKEILNLKTEEIPMTAEMRRDLAYSPPKDDSQK